ncbi:Acb2/Tad1 domain-containing protein [Cronobacter malonaticus]
MTIAHTRMQEACMWACRAVVRWKETAKALQQAFTECL